MHVFSKENFKRSEEEVATLMNLMKEKKEVLIDKEIMVIEYGIQVWILGELSLLPQCVRRATGEVMGVSVYNGNNKQC